MACIWIEGYDKFGLQIRIKIHSYFFMSDFQIHVPIHVSNPLIQLLKPKLILHNLHDSISTQNGI